MLLYKRRGFVLLFVLIFLQISILLSTFLMADVHDGLQLAHDHWQYLKLNYAAQSAMNTLEINNQFLQQHCLIPTTTPDFLLQQSVSWWQKHACFSKSQQAMFVTEFLSRPDCVISVKNKSVNFYRITLFISEKRNHFYLQDVVAIQNPMPPPRCTDPQPVDLGRQTRHIL